MLIAEVMGTVENGTLTLDEVLPFPDKTRVKLRVEPAWNPTEARQAWEALMARVDEHPIPGLAANFSRDELYERG